MNVAWWKEGSPLMCKVLGPRTTAEGGRGGKGEDLAYSMTASIFYCI